MILLEFSGDILWGEWMFIPLFSWVPPCIQIFHRNTICLGWHTYFWLCISLPAQLQPSITYVCSSYKLFLLVEGFEFSLKT